MFPQWKPLPSTKIETPWRHHPLGLPQNSLTCLPATIFLSLHLISHSYQNHILHKQTYSVFLSCQEEKVQTFCCWIWGSSRHDMYLFSTDSSLTHLSHSLMLQAHWSALYKPTITAPILFSCSSCTQNTSFPSFSHDFYSSFKTQFNYYLSEKSSSTASGEWGTFSSHSLL